MLKRLWYKTLSFTQEKKSPRFKQKKKKKINLVRISSLSKIFTKDILERESGYLGDNDGGKPLLKETGGCRGSMSMEWSVREIDDHPMVNDDQ